MDLPLPPAEGPPRVRGELRFSQKQQMHAPLSDDILHVCGLHGSSIFLRRGSN